MYLHIGQDTVVRYDDIIGIFDIDTTSVSGITKEFLKKSQLDGNIVSVSDDLPKSFLVCKGRKKKDENGLKVYISQISSTTLLKRASVDDEFHRDARE